MPRFLFLPCLALLAALCAAASAQMKGAEFTVHSARTGRWSDPKTWAEHRVPGKGDTVQVRAGHAVTYDVDSDQPIRMIHVAGTLAFSRERSTRLDVGLIKVQPGDTASEDGFECDMHPEATPEPDPRTPRPVLEIGTADRPIPAGVTATLRLTYFEGMNKETLPAILNCGGRWDLHGAPMSRTWVKLGATAKAGDSSVTLSEGVSGWKAGDKVILTASRERYLAGGRRGGYQPGKAEERVIRSIQGAAVTLDRPLLEEHFGEGEYRSEIADLSRNVVIESADPDGVRGHTMFHRNSTGGVSYAEFRHLGKEGVLGKYSLHFHLVRDSMRGSGVVGASIWDSRNRWLTIHGTDYLLVRDCVGYQSVGHGFFLEDGTEQYNILDRNLAVQAYDGKPLPKQVLPFDANDGAGFWWANGRNTLTRNVACENDHYGFHYEVAKRSNFDPELVLRTPDGRSEKQDIRTIPFFRFEGNESHTEGLYSFNFGDDVNPSVHGDRKHPFIARNLKAWETHYVLRPNLQFFLMDGLDVKTAVYGVYHPDYDAHVYRSIHLDGVNSEPINRGHDDDSIQYGSFTYDGLTLENCRIGRDPLIQLADTSPTAGQSGHFRNLTIKNSASPAKVVDLGGGPRNDKVQNGVAYFFHDFLGPGRVTEVVSAKVPEMLKGADFASIEGFTGKDVRAADVSGVSFPTLLEPVDDLPPATVITSAKAVGNRLLVRGVSQDNGEIASVTVNGHPAKIGGTAPGSADWEITLEAPRDGLLRASATDRAGNREVTGHELKLRKDR
jgi:hypothetical protein